MLEVIGFVLLQEGGRSGWLDVWVLLGLFALGGLFALFEYFLRRRK